MSRSLRRAEQQSRFRHLEIPDPAPDDEVPSGHPPYALEHGGRLRQAAAEYGIPLSDWLDLSTGINPNGWPVPAIPPLVWTRLPEDEDGLLEAAQAYYGARSLLPVAGTQAAIQALPRLRPRGRIGILSPGYAEHALAWRTAGHDVIPFDPGGEPPAGLDAVLIIHPNNPTGHTYSMDRVLAWHKRLAARGGWLVVDEAFMDVTPEFSVAGQDQLRGLIVLRSLGKFFGLAGARVGFVLGDEDLLHPLRRLLGPWTLTGPSREVARLALADRTWQSATRVRLLAESDRLAELLARHGPAPSGGTALFQWVETDRASDIQSALASRGILVRRFDEPASLRFGLPGSEVGWQRLDQALGEIVA